MVIKDPIVNWPSDDDDDALIAIAEQAEQSLKKTKIVLVVIHNPYVEWTRFRFLWAPVDDDVMKKMDEFDALSDMMWKSPKKAPEGYGYKALQLVGSLTSWTSCGFSGKFMVPEGHVIERVATVEMRIWPGSDEDDV